MVFGSQLNNAQSLEGQSNMSEINIAVPLRINASAGELETTFTRVVVDKDGKMSLEQWPLTNDFGGKWVNFPAMTQFHLISRCETPDVYILAVVTPDDPEPKGLVLRRAGYNNLLNASEGVMQEFVAKKLAAEAAKATKTTATKAVQPKVKQPPKVMVINLDPEPAQPATESETTETGEEQS